MTTTLAQWFSPISDSKWFFLARMVNGGGGGESADAKTDCGLSVLLMSSLGFYPGKLCTQWSMSVTHSLCQILFGKNSFIIKMGGFLAFMFCKISL